MGEVVLVPLVIGLVEVAKRVGVGARWLPLVALGLGVGLRVLAAAGTGGVGDPIVQGLAVGLAAVGLYSGTRATVGAAGGERE